MSALTSLLVRDQVVSVREIEEAIQRQVISGGDIDTVLLEMGKVAENVMSAYRAALYNVLPATRDEVMTVSRETLRFLPRELAERYRAIPLRAEGGTLVVATSEPLPEDAEEELSAALGCEIVFRLVPEVRVCAALHHHYGVEMSPRMRRLAEQLRQRDAGQVPYVRPPEGTRVERGRSDVPRKGFAFEGLSSADTELTDLSSLSDPAPAASPHPPPEASPPARRRSARPASQPPAVGVVASRVVGVSMKPAPKKKKPRVRGPVISEDLAKRLRGPLPARAAADLLAEARSRDEILEVLFAFARQFFDYTAAFVVHDEIAEGRDAFGPGTAGDDVRSIAVPLDVPGAFGEARRTGGPRVLDPEGSGLDRIVTRDLARESAQPSVVVPFAIRQRVVVLLYGDRGGDRFGLTDVPELLAFSPRVGAAFERLIVQRKLQGYGATDETSKGEKKNAVSPSERVRVPKSDPPPAGSWQKSESSRPRAGGPSVLRSVLGLPGGPPPRRSYTPIATRAVRPGGAPRPEVLDLLGVPRAPPAPSSRPPNDDDDYDDSDPAPRGPDTMPSPPPTPDGDGAGETEDSEGGSDDDAGESEDGDEDDEADFEASAADDDAADGPDDEPFEEHDDDGEDYDADSSDVMEYESLPPDERTPPPLLGPRRRDAPPPRPRGKRIPDAGAYKMKHARVDVVARSEGGRRSPSSRPPPPSRPAASRPAPSRPASPRPAPSRPPPIRRPPSRPAPERASSERPASERDARPGIAEDIVRNVPDVKAPEAVDPAPPPAETKRPSLTDADQPSIIVNMGENVEQVVADLTKQGPDDEGRALRGVLTLGEVALPVLVQEFPGPLWFSRHQRHVRLPRGRDVSAIARALCAFEERAVPYVACLLDDRNDDVRFYATLLASEFHHRDLVAPLARRVFDFDPQTRQLALDVLRPLRSFREEFDEVLAGVRSAARVPRKDRELRLVAIQALGELRDERAVPLLVMLLDDPDEGIRRSARKSLVLLTAQDFGESGRRWAGWVEENGARHRIEWLIDSLTHAEEAIRAAASEELKQITQEYVGYHPGLPRREREICQRKYRRWWDEVGRTKFPIARKQLRAN